ncbi:MAG: hypothetical protein KBC41_02720 [Candidatus Pacebacteria bacterium]|nr:hypothetical protein [Candidatus Paceibacterota bacterium]
MKIKKILSLFIAFFVLYLFLHVLVNFLQYIKIKNNTQKILTVNEYNSVQVDKISNFETSLKTDNSLDEYLNDKKVYELFTYANALTRQHDFIENDRSSSTIKAINIYKKILDSNVSDRYKAGVLNEIYTAFVQSGSNIDLLRGYFSEEQLENKKKYFKLSGSFEKLRQQDKLFLVQNLLLDEEVKSNLLSSTKIAIARISMQDYINQLFLRTVVNNSLDKNKDEQIKNIKNIFSNKVIKDYEEYKKVEANTIKPDVFYQVESKYLMAWSLNRAATYASSTDSKKLIEESYKMFEENIALTENLKKTSNDFWGLSIMNKIFYATVVIGSNKDAVIDTWVVENRNKSLDILSELSSPTFMTNYNYTGARLYLSMMKDSNFDWITSLALLSKYDAGLKNNLVKLGWKL